MRALAAAAGLAWAFANLVVAYLFVTQAYVARTVAKEGSLAQALLVLGGLTLGVFALALAWQCFRLVTRRPDSG